MLIKEEVDLAISVINGVINLIEAIDPAAKQNNAVLALQKAISVIESVGL
jgi:hypothetical protein